MSNRIYINVSDWYDDAKDNKVSIQNTEDIALLIEHGNRPRRVGEWLVALIQNEESPPELLPDAKELLAIGANTEVYVLIRAQKDRITYKSKRGEEKEAVVRRFNHWGGKLVRDDSEDSGDDGIDIGYVSVNDRENYLDNAVRRLHSISLGHVRNALAEIRVSGGDAEGEWGVFKGEVEVILEGLE